MHVPAPIVLLDEVLLVGDEQFRQKCEQELARLRREGRTVVLISHVLSHILEWSDRVAYLDHGKLVTVGKPAEVVEQYTRSLV